MLYMIGLGLDNDEITVKGKEALKKADKAYAEFYTNTETVDLEKLEDEVKTPIEKLSREKVEQEDTIVKEAEEKDIAFLVSGDSLTATTHYDIKHRAEQKEIKVEVFHAPSIFLSIAETGLNVYKFGRTVTLPEDMAPESIVDHIKKNDSVGLHTLILLDINYDAAEAAEKLVKLDESLKDRKAVVLERANADDQEISVIKLGEAVKEGFGKPPHSIILPGKMSHMEKDFVESHR